MKNEPTKSCTYCGSTAHATRSCYVKAAGLPSLAQIAKAQRQAERDAAKAAKAQAKADKIAAVAAAKAEKERIKAERASRSRISCSYCYGRGHTRVGCKVIKDDLAKVITVVAASRAAYWETIKAFNVGIGSFVTYSGYGYYIPSAEYLRDHPNQPAEWVGWSGNAKDRCEQQIVVGFTLTQDWRHPVKMHTLPVTAVGTQCERNDVNLPVIGDYFNGVFKQYWLGESNNNRGECYLTDWVRMFQPVGATTVQNSIDADELAKWLAGEDVNKWAAEHAPRKSRSWGRRGSNKGYDRTTLFSQFDMQYIKKYTNTPDHVFNDFNID